MKVALLFPGITMTGFAKPGDRPKTGWIHHGLCSIASALKNKGHDVTLIDLRQLTGYEELPVVIKKIKPDIVGITIMSVDFDPAIKSAQLIKQVDGNIKIVVGGIHPSVMEWELTGNNNIDYVFKGEAEITFPKVLEDIKNKSIEGKIIQGEPPDLDQIPFVDRGLYKILEPPIVPYLKMPFFTTVTGRGCIYNCNFCQPAERKLFGRKVRRVSVERFIEELSLAGNDGGFNSIMFWDDCLVEDIRWVSRFLDLYSKKGFRKPFVCQARSDIVVKNPGLFRDMRKCGLAMLLIGFESGNQRVLNFLRKGTKVEHNYKAAEICKRLGIRIFANFMLGIPSETKKEAEETVRMIKKIRPYMPSPTFYTPFPGSDLFEYCKEKGLSLIKDHSEYMRDPVAPKIKGIDYTFLNRLLEEVNRIPRSVKIRRKIDRLSLGRFNKDMIEKYTVVNSW